MVLVGALVAPGHKQVIALEPGYIIPQDGHDKQDCEQATIKRWAKRNAGHFGAWQVTILTDDLHSHQPLCQLLLEHQLHFIMTCKTECHSALQREVECLKKIGGAVVSMTVRHWNGRCHERRIYGWTEQVLLRAGVKSLDVNWCEITIFREDTGKQIYHNAWITSHPLTSWPQAHWLRLERFL